MVCFDGGESMTCMCCMGTGWKRTLRDVSKIYGRKQLNTYTRPCPRCNCTGHVPEPIDDGKTAAAQD
jgi:hypothetical protein